MKGDEKRKGDGETERERERERREEKRRERVQHTSLRRNSAATQWDGCVHRREMHLEGFTCTGHLKLSLCGATSLESIQ